MKPHPYQENYLADIRKALLLFMRILVVSPTGSGKTCMFSWLTEEFVKTGKRVLILADQDELIWQPIKKLKEVAGLTAEPEKAGDRASMSARVVVGSVQTMARRLDRWPHNHFDIIIADEADKSVAAQWQSVLNHFDRHAKVIGFTATPHRTDGMNLGVYYQTVIEHETLFSLIHKGFLSPIKVQMFPVNIDIPGLGKKRDDFSDEEVDEILTPHLEELAKVVQNYGSFRRTLVFLPLVKTCEKFTEIARDIGISAQYVHGQHDKRDEIIESFRRWDFDVLANSMLMTRGVDIPEVDCVAPFRFTMSVTLYTQIVGRGTRLAPGKSDCLLLDPLFQATKRLVCNPAHLIANDDDEAERIAQLIRERSDAMPADIASEMDILQLVSDATSVREASLRKKLEEQKHKKAQMISPEEFASMNEAVNNPQNPILSSETKPPSEEQLKWLRAAKIDPLTGKIFLRGSPARCKPLDVEEIKSAAHAERILNVVFDKSKRGIMLASHGQRAKMKQLGHPNWENATESEARQFFASLNKRKEPQLL